MTNTTTMKYHELITVLAEAIRETDKLREQGKLNPMQEKEVAAWEARLPEHGTDTLQDLIAAGPHPWMVWQRDEPVEVIEEKEL